MRQPHDIWREAHDIKLRKIKKRFAMPRHTFPLTVHSSSSLFLTTPLIIVLPLMKAVSKALQPVSRCAEMVSSWSQPKKKRFLTGIYGPSDASARSESDAEKWFDEVAHLRTSSAVSGWRGSARVPHGCVGLKWLTPAAAGSLPPSWIGRGAPWLAGIASLRTVS
jgi:hypothetical protein